MEWKTINGFENYEINLVGQIRNKKTLKILSQSLSSKGYYQVNIANKSRRVHRLLAVAFIENPNNLETVNHKDGNKLNNSIENLEWMNRVDNVIHSREDLKLKPIPYSKSNKEHHLLGKNGSKSNRGKSVKVTFPDGTIKIFGSKMEAGIILFNDEKIGEYLARVPNRKNNYYNGLKFENYE